MIFLGHSRSQNWSPQLQVKQDFDTTSVLKRQASWDSFFNCRVNTTAANNPQNAIAEWSPLSESHTLSARDLPNFIFWYVVGLGVTKWTLCHCREVMLINVKSLWSATCIGFASLLKQRKWFKPQLAVTTFWCNWTMTMGFLAGFKVWKQSLETKFGTRIQRRLWHLPKIVTATEDILLLCPQCFLSQWESWCRNQCPEDSKTKKWGLWCPALISDSFENTMRCPWWRGLKLFSGGVTHTHKHIYIYH